MLSPNTPWLSADDFQESLDQARHGEAGVGCSVEIEKRAKRLGLVLPAGFASFARDFRRRGAVEGRGFYGEVCLHDAVLEAFPQVGDGYLILASLT